MLASLLAALRRRARTATPPRRRPLGLERLEDRAVPAVVASYAVTQDWGTGFQAQVKLVNDGASAVPFGQLQFNLASSITSIYDAKLLSHVGNHYAVTNAGWDATIPAGGSVTFGFTAACGSSTATTDFVFGDPASNPPATPPPANPPAGTNAQLTFASTGDWGTGMNGQITIANKGTSPLNNWTLGFDFAGPITSLWNGSILSHVGNHYTVGPASWNSSIAPGGSVVVGFTAGKGGLVATNLTLTTPGAPANHAPTAGADSAKDTAGSPVQIAVLANDTDPDGDALTITTVGKAAHGTAVVNKDSTVTYTASAGYVGTDSFTYAISDGKGGTATGTVTVSVTAPTTPAASSWPAQVFAPYADATLYPTYDFVSAAKTQGVKFFTLAFITADTLNQPAWGGYDSYAVNGSDFSSTMSTQIAALRALGGDVAVSFGGASGQELAQTITNVNALTAAYRSVIQTYGLTPIDFDIEGAAVADRASIDRRSQAIATLQQEAKAAGRELNVRFTLPVLPTGLTADGLYVLQSAVKYGARIDLVNVMAMDYGDGAAPNPAGHMGDYAIQAATSLFNQLTSQFGSKTDAQRWAMVGVTPMIGRNDLTNEVFAQQDARQLEAWAAQHHIGLVSMWSIQRDKQNAAGAISYVDLTSSSLLQSPYEFSSIFEAFVR
jgi:hypothetical protein